MKKNRGLFILIGILIILLAVYFGLQSWNKSREEKEQKEQEESEIHVTDTAGEEIVSLKYDVGNGEMEFVKEDDQWYYAADKDFPLAQSYPEDMASAVGNIQADRELENGDSMEDYGLEEPVYTVEYTDTEGNITQLYFGNMTGEYYYMTVGDTGKVYTVDGTAIESLTYSLDDMAQFDDYPSIGSGNLVKEVITQNGQTTVYDSEDEAQEEDLAGFGLDEASRITVEATYTEDEEEKVLTLYIGNQDGEGSRYVMMNDSRIVYLISDEICNNILNI